MMARFPGRFSGRRGRGRRTITTPKEEQGSDAQASVPQGAPSELTGASPSIDPASFGALLGRSVGSPGMQAGLLQGLQRSYGNSYVGNVIGSADAARANGGNPIDPETRAELESGLGEEMGSVRVHNDEESDRLARSIGAEAFTSGDHIFFRSGGYDPSSSEGMHLLRHEAAHTVQQRGDGAEGIAPADSELEREADRTAAGSTGEAPALTSGATSALQRKPAPGGSASPATAQAAPNPEREALLGNFYSEEGEAFDVFYDPFDGRGFVKVIARVYFDFQDAKQEWIDKHFDEVEKQLNDPQLAHDQFHWSDSSRGDFTEKFIQSAYAGWSGHHMLRCARAGLQDVTAAVELNIEPTTDPESAHAIVRARKVPEGFSHLSGSSSGHAKERKPGEKRKALISSLDADHPATKQSKLTLLARQIAPFGQGSSTITPELEQQISRLAKEINSFRDVHNINDRTLIIRGYGHEDGQKEEENASLARARAGAVYKELEKAGAEMLPFPENTAMERGLAKSADPKYRRVDVEMITLALSTLEQNVIAHELGHLLFDLGDEYPDSEDERLSGDKPSHYTDVEQELGGEEAKKGIVGQGISIMASGNLVQPGHYVRIIQAMERMTGFQWTV